MKKKKENRWRLHSLLRKSTPTNLKSIVWPAAMLCIENCGVRRRHSCCRFNVWNSFLVCTYLHTIAAVLCIGFESADFCLHSFTTVEKSKISVSPNDCGGRFVNRVLYYQTLFATYILDQAVSAMDFRLHLKNLFTNTLHKQ